jgi:hypothetical protein
VKGCEEWETGMGVLPSRGRGDFFLGLGDEGFWVRVVVFLRTVRLAGETFFLVRDVFFMVLGADKNKTRILTHPTAKSNFF